MFQGDANRSYSDEDRSSSNMEDFDQFQEVQEGSGTIAQTVLFSCVLLLFGEKSKSRFCRKFTPTFENLPDFILNFMPVCGVICGKTETCWHPEECGS